MRCQVAWLPWLGTKRVAYRRVDAATLSRWARSAPNATTEIDAYASAMTVAIAMRLRHRRSHRTTTIKPARKIATAAPAKRPLSAKLAQTIRPTSSSGAHRRSRSQDFHSTKTHGSVVTMNHPGTQYE